MNVFNLIDTETDGGRYDVTPLFSNYKIYQSVIKNLCQPLLSLEIELVLGIDALGFILGTSISHYLQCGFVPLRKGGKLPVSCLKQSFIDYSNQTKILEVRKDILKHGVKVIIVDEWVETGSQMQAAVNLVEACNAKVIRLVSLHVDKNEKTNKLESDYGFISLNK